jgi:DNA-binding MarR family transcriptional regulator
LEIVRGHCPEIGLTGILVMLYVAENPGINIAEVADICGLTDATASRTVRALTSPDSEGALPPSLGLLQIFPNPGDARGRVLFLSAEGKRLCRSLDDAIARASPIEQMA